MYHILSDNFREDLIFVFWQSLLHRKLLNKQKIYRVLISIGN